MEAVLVAGLAIGTFVGAGSMALAARRATDAEIAEAWVAGYRAARRDLRGEWVDDDDLDGTELQGWSPWSDGPGAVA